MSSLNKILNSESELFSYFTFQVEQRNSPMPIFSPIPSNSSLSGRVAVLPPKKEIMLLIEQKQWTRVFSLLDPLCDDPITDVEYLALRATAYIKNKDPIHALQDTEKALTIKPNEPRLLVTQANLRKHLFGTSFLQPNKKQKIERN